MPLRDRVSAHADRLTEADRRLLDVLLSHPGEAGYLSATQVSKRAGVHPATATKLAQKLGYTGYPGLRRSLQAELFDGASPADRVQRRLEQAGDGSILASLVEDELLALADLPRQVAQADLDRAAALLAGARHRYVFAHGNSAVLAEMLHRRLDRYALPTTVLARSGRELAEQVVGVGPGDLVVAFAFRRMPTHLLDLATHLRAVGADLVLVTDTLAADLVDLTTLTLTGARGSGREFQSLTVPMAITNALVLTVARQSPQHTGDALSRLEKLLATFEG